MFDKRVEAAAAEKKMFFDNTWSAAATFESAFSSSDKQDWYSEARIVRGGFAMSQLSSEFLDDYLGFVLNNIRIRGTSKRRESKESAIQGMFSQQQAAVRNAVQVWKDRAHELTVTLPEERPNSSVALYADAEIRDLVIHLKSEKLTKQDFDEKIADVMTRYQMTSTDLSEWKVSQDIQY